MAVNVQISPARFCDVWAFEHMRAADRAEVQASGGYEPVQAIVESWASSREAWTARFNGEVGAMYGVSVHPCGVELAPVGVVWLLTTDVINKYPIAFYRRCKPVLDDYAVRYGLLYNYVDARHEQALGWARRLGFRVLPSQQFGPEGRQFHPIVYGGA